MLYVIILIRLTLKASDKAYAGVDVRKVLAVF